MQLWSSWEAKCFVTWFGGLNLKKKKKLEFVRFENWAKSCREMFLSALHFSRFLIQTWEGSRESVEEVTFEIGDPGAESQLGPHGERSR